MAGRFARWNEPLENCDAKVVEVLRESYFTMPLESGDSRVFLRGFYATAVRRRRLDGRTRGKKQVCENFSRALLVLSSFTKAGLAAASAAL